MQSSTPPGVRAHYCGGAYSGLKHTHALGARKQVHGKEIARSVRCQDLKLFHTILDVASVHLRDAHKLLQLYSLCVSSYAVVKKSAVCHRRSVAAPPGSSRRRRDRAQRGS